MTLLSIMQARIANDLARPDLTNQIATAINDAITHHQSTRYWFTETRTAGFSTVAGQYLYTAADDPDIPLMFEFDDVQITSSTNNYSYPMWREDATVLEELISWTTSHGNPTTWAWADQGILIYPIPNSVRSVRLIGGIKKAAPVDDTPGNVWMTEAFELIRCHAEGLLFTHTIKDLNQAGAAFQAAELAKARLERETSAKRATGTVRATPF